MSKATGIIIGLILLAFGGLVAWTIIEKNNNAIDYSVYDINKPIAADENNGGIGDHVIGSEDAEVFIVEYADFQCEGCATMNSRVANLIEEYEGKVAVIYRNFLMSYHQNAFAAASAVEAAGLQGKWAEMKDSLFTNQATWSSLSDSSRNDAFAMLFSSLGDNLDSDKFLSDMNSSEVKLKVDFDQGVALKASAPGTPSFFLDGEQISTGSGESEFMANMREAIDKKLGE